MARARFYENTDNTSFPQDTQASAAASAEARRDPCLLQAHAHIETAPSGPIEGGLVGSHKF